MSNIYVVVFKLEDHHSEPEEFFLSTLQMSFQEYFLVSKKSNNNVEMFLNRWLVMMLPVSSYENLLSGVTQGNRYLQINIMILQTTVIAFSQFKANIEMFLSRWLVMTLPVSSYEELLSRVRSITQETRQLQRQLDSPLLDHNENGELFWPIAIWFYPFSI